MHFWGSSSFQRPAVNSDSARASQTGRPKASAQRLIADRAQWSSAKVKDRDTQQSGYIQQSEHASREEGRWIGKKQGHKDMLPSPSDNPPPGPLPLQQPDR